MIIWLASYPKSGNTWLRMFLKSYFLKQDEKFSLEDSVLDNFKGQSFPDDKILNHLKVDYFNFEEIVKNWETMQDYINLNNKTNYVKTHNAMCTINNNKFTDTHNTLGVIHIVRDPRNVISSIVYHFSKKNYEEAREFLFDENKDKESKHIYENKNKNKKTNRESIKNKKNL